MIIQATSLRKSSGDFKFLFSEAPQRTGAAWLTSLFPPCKSLLCRHGDVPSETLGEGGVDWHPGLRAATHLDASKILASSKLLTHFYTSPWSRSRAYATFPGGHAMDAPPPAADRSFGPSNQR